MWDGSSPWQAPGDQAAHQGTPRARWPGTGATVMQRPTRQMAQRAEEPTIMSTTNETVAARTPVTDRVITRGQSRAVFGQVMGLVALTVACTALGSYVGRHLSGGTGVLFFIGGIACLIGLNTASSRGHEQSSIALLFGLGLFLGLAVAPVLADYARTQPSVLWQAAGSTALSVAALGTVGYATRRDLSGWARGLFWGLLALIVFGIVGVFVTVPSGNII